MRQYRLVMLMKFLLMALLSIACVSVIPVSNAHASRFNWASEAPGCARTDLVLRGVTYGSSLYVAVGDPGCGTSLCDIETSSDGITWTARSCPSNLSDTSLNAVAYGNGTYVAVGGE